MVGSRAKRLALPAALLTAWLLLATGPAFADGGPHVMTANNGIGGGGGPALGGDCASCHRAHTAGAADLLAAAVPTLCTNCHNGTKATTDVQDGVQFKPSGSVGVYDNTSANVLGALRGGGFVSALIDSGNAARLVVAGALPPLNPTDFRGHVGVLQSGQRVTSTHSGTGTVWGNGAPNSGVADPGPAGVTLACTNCHNPHGNGQYRILSTLPGADWSAPFAPTNAGGVQVAEAYPLTLSAGQVRNYTVRGSTDGLTTGVQGSTADGDYWRAQYDPTGLTTWTKVPSNPKDVMNVGWNGSRPVNSASNGGVQPPNSNGLMTAWCIQCHSRYSGLPSQNPITGTIDPSSVVPMQPMDKLFTYKHGTTNWGCEQCHVSHGSNAVLSSNGSLTLEAPSQTVPPVVPGAGAGGTTVSADSRLLKIDNLGTCNMCHDPTNAVAGGDYTGPIPSPGL